MSLLIRTHGELVEVDIDVGLFACAEEGGGHDDVDCDCLLDFLLGALECEFGFDCGDFVWGVVDFLTTLDEWGCRGNGEEAGSEEG